MPLGTYFYVVTAYGAGGESLNSNQITVPVTVPGTQAVNLTWSSVPSAAYYNVYRTTVTGTYLPTSLVEQVAQPAVVPPTLAATDTGAAFAGVPILLRATAGSSGGALAAGTYYYEVTAVGASGESLLSNQLSVAVATNQQVALTWSSVPNATSYNVYRSTVAGVYSSSSVLAHTPYTSLADTGPTFAQTPPLTLASGLSKIGAGTLTLGQNDTYRGTTYVQAGNLDIQQSNSLGLNNGDAIQRLSVVDPGGADKFKLTTGGVTTANIPFGASAAVVSADLNAILPNGAAGAVQVVLNTVFSGTSQEDEVSLVGYSSNVADSDQDPVYFRRHLDDRHLPGRGGDGDRFRRL